MDSKAGYNEAYFQEIYNKQNDSRLINDTFSGNMYIDTFSSKGSYMVQLSK